MPCKVPACMSDGHRKSGHAAVGQNAMDDHRFLLGNRELATAVDMLRALGAKRVLLFGSYPESPETARDIDIAVEGIPLERILEADVAVSGVLRMPVDLVSREENPRFFSLISRGATVLYE